MKILQVGEAVPNFTTTDQDGNTVSLSDYKGKKLVVFFYPAASTPTCTVEACNLRDNYAVLKEAGYEILGVSADTERKQKNFSKKYKFQYPLLADTNKEVINAFGVWGPKKFMGRTFNGIHRITFVIDEKGIVTKVIDDVKSKIHAEQILS
ncbi:peroxiredoxin Q/BCP [Ulvibacter sp. MAR_2010_11]|uniref:thioredoxin-dependent thiol peroxidase n=1 Tax=Ulvibacter sp. MAR_2010_11 TaxID=1250229 RepID=UPI000C2BA63D|nr:thioredoxin-dependent thiol peroxidase [Ulvibacter sp. MAR_2010_11]PKA84047.1 peroxiredoxin Q/BCP [Ulvibacter sp. MAR_2010_11]